MKLKKIAIIGHFGFGLDLLNGQTVKTKTIAIQLEKYLGVENVLKVDTRGGKRNPLKILFRVFKAFKQCEGVLIIPASGALKTMVSFVDMCNKFFKRKTFYVEIGGKTQSLLKKDQSLLKKMKKFTGVFVETKDTLNILKDLDFKNVSLMPNCKELNILTEEELVYPQGEPYKLCTFSRVMKEKGIEDAVNAVKAVNEQLGRTVYTLDIYGQVDDNQVEWFEALQQEFPEYIKYGGLVPFDKSVEVLKNYFALLFPTRFYTEGIPGTIIDAYSAGVPVISAKWKHYSDIVCEQTGIGYKFEDLNEFKNILTQLVVEPKRCLALRSGCTQKAREYQPELIMTPLLIRI